MESRTIRIARSTHDLIRKLADKEGTTMAEVVARSVDAYRRRQFWADYHAAYAAIQAVPAASAELRREVGAWDTTSAD
jgi:hypothetical protein